MAKKTFSIILALLLTVQVITGCGSEKETDDTSSQSDTTADSTGETTQGEPNKKDGLWYADYLPVRITVDIRSEL